MTILLHGTCKIIHGEGQEHMDSLVNDNDREPVFGLQSCLPHEQWKSVRQRTAKWKVRAEDHVDTAWVSRDDILECFAVT